MIPQDYRRDELDALQAKERAQWIAFAPFVFQAARCLRESGLLAAVERAGALTLEQAARAAELPPYAVRVLLEAGLAIGLLTEREDGFRTTKTAHYLLHDPLTAVNFGFTQQVNYRGLFALEQSLREGRPAGLASFGPWPTIYDALAELPQATRQAWFACVHYYSDSAFPAALPHVFRRAPRRLLDIGGNTGRWALACTQHDPQVQVTILDLPGQLRDARRAVAQAGLGARIDFCEADLLDAATRLPGGFDAVWMSQFLFCFSEPQIVSILARCARTLDADARLYILEPYWDRQRFALSAFCLQMTSLYFAALANGCSQMYRSPTFLACIRAAGLAVEEQVDGLGVTQSLLVCRREAA